jgi:HlyD family secretion protein
MDTETNTSPDVATALGGFGAPAPWKRHIKWAVIAALVAGVAYFIFGRGDGSTTHYITQEVTRGDLTVTVTATGNLEPRNQVDIGSELSGTMRKVNVDVNDVVQAGQVLAVLDTTRLKAQVLQAESSLQAAEARSIQSAATVKEARANYQRLLKVRELSNNKIPSQQDMDVAEATAARAEGDVAAAKAAVAQARASLEAVRTDLSKNEIRSPINGVVLVRSVEEGQTVAASLQAPILFTLAEDLKKMELHVSVDEADVGAVEVGQKATFTVDAFPNRTFHAHITQVHFASNNTQKSSSSSSSSASSSTSTGVVTYETVLEVDNSELLLRPGMTATAEIVTTSIQDALLIPNAALRFTPEGAQVPGTPGAQQQRGALSALMPQIRMRGPGGSQQGGMSRRMSRAWIMEDGKPVLAMFRSGPSDGRMTQILPLDRQPDLARTNRPNANGNGNAAVAEELKKATQRKLDKGTAVIVDSETQQKK